MFENGLASLDGAAVNGFDGIGQRPREHVAHRTADVSVNRGAVNRRELFVDADVAKVAIEKAEADDGFGVDRLKFGESIAKRGVGVFKLLGLVANSHVQVIVRLAKHRLDAAGLSAKRLIMSETMSRTPKAT